MHRSIKSGIFWNNYEYQKEGFGVDNILVILWLSEESKISAKNAKFKKRVLKI